jgi:hypothetical protein
MIETMHAYYQLAANTEVPDMDAKAASDSSLSQTVAAGSTTPVKFRLVLPDGAPEDAFMVEAHQSTDYYTPATNIGEMLNLDITRSDEPTGVNADGKKYWELTLTPRAGGFTAGSESAAVKFTNVQDASWDRNPLYYAEITLTVQ